MQSSPLEGIKVLATRAENQIQALSILLENKGAEVYKLPMIELVPSNNHLEKQEVLKHLHQVDWLIFTSANAVKFFFETAEKYNIQFYFLTELRIATVGEKTKKAIEELGFRTNFVPNDFTAEMLFKQLPDVSGKNILIPRSEKASDRYIEQLEQRGAKVKSVIFYNNEKVLYFQNEFLRVMNKGIDFLTFTSGSTVKAFHDYCQKFNFELSNEKVVVIGPSTHKIAVDLGMKVTAVAQNLTAEGIVAEIEKIVQHESATKT